MTFEQYSKHKCKNCKYRDLDAIYDICNIHTDISGNLRCPNYCKCNWFSRLKSKIKHIFSK